MEDKVYINKVNIDLDELTYKKIDNQSGEFKVNINQHLELVNISFDTFTIKVTRTIDLTPKGLFNLNISLNVIFTIDKEKTAKNYMVSIEELSKHIDNHLNEFYNFSSADQHLSCLISQITSWFGKNPLILPGKLE